MLTRFPRIAFGFVFVLVAAQGISYGAEPRDPVQVAGGIDREIDSLLAEKGLPASPAADDAEFLRRACLDLTGKLPTAEQAARFLDSKDAENRRRLIDDLLSSPDYGRHFSIVWQNLILPQQSDIQFLALVGPDGVPAFGQWLADSFNRDKPWDSMARELITAEGSMKEVPAVVYTMSNMERAVVRPDLLGASTARLFLGVQLQCVECHDHFFNDWKQQDFWGVAAFFGQTRFSMPAQVRPGAGAIVESAGNRRGPIKINGPEITIPTTGGNKGAGKVVRARFLGGPEPSLSEAGPYRSTFAEWMTADDNPYFGPATVNRLWGHLFARGLVHPVDDMQAGQLASHPKLLQLLAEELRGSHYSLKHLLRSICNSRAYQRSSGATPGNEQDAALCSHMAVKVMSPDVLYDALLQVLEVKQLEFDLPESLRVLLPPAERARLRFVRFFRTEAAEADEFARGVPHVLSLLNSEAVNATTPAVRKLSSLPPEQAVEQLYLTALTRRPTADERKLMDGYLANRAAVSPAERYAAVLWILLNSSEFVMNH